MKEFVKALQKEGRGFKYLCDQFPSLSEAKLKGVFVGPDIKERMKNLTFDIKRETNERNAWKSLMLIITSFFGIITSFCSISLKVHFLDSHLDYFPENLGAVCEEQSERFHQDIKEMEREM